MPSRRYTHSMTEEPRSCESKPWVGRAILHVDLDAFFAAVEQLERRFLSEALQRCEGNVSRAAEEIGIQRTNLHALMRKYGLSSEG